MYTNPIYIIDLSSSFRKKYFGRFSHPLRSPPAEPPHQSTALQKAGQNTRVACFFLERERISPALTNTQGNASFLFKVNSGENFIVLLFFRSFLFFPSPVDLSKKGRDAPSGTPLPRRYESNGLLIYSKLSFASVLLAIKAFSQW